MPPPRTATTSARLADRWADAAAIPGGADSAADDDDDDDDDDGDGDDDVCTSHPVKTMMKVMVIRMSAIACHETSSVFEGKLLRFF